MESLDFAANFPFVGEEVLDLKIFTPTLDKIGTGGIIQGRFYIYKMSDRTEMAEKNVMYQLHFISIEAIADLNTKTSKGYDGKVSDIVSKILKEENLLSTDKTVTVEETANKTKYVSNFWSPVRNINYLLNYAQSSASNSPTYTFFENRFGFNFISLDALNLAQPVQEFSVNNSNQQVNPMGGSSRNLDLDFKRIVDMNIDTTYDYMDKVRSGAFGSTLLYMDLTTKKYYNKKFSIFDDWAKGGRLNANPIASNNLYATYRGAMFADNIELGLFTDWDDVSNIQVRQKRISRLKQAEAYKIEIVVPGRTDYTVGKTVTIKKFKSEPLKESDNTNEVLDDLISGKYLVSAIHHNINKQKHECRMELIKDSLTMNLDKAGKK
jgi:hypothetical protein